MCLRRGVVLHSQAPEGLSASRCAVLSSLLHLHEKSRQGFITDRNKTQASLFQQGRKERFSRVSRQPTLDHI
ncbi:hypothetical protein GOP47_0027763 [Adiantum capillus-veneris]|nr:hypothetical protein GOP47_0027763 [Adiantum capillus-veneris]